MAACKECGNPADTDPCEECIDDMKPGCIAADVLAAGISDILESSADENSFKAAGGIRRVTSFESDGVLTSDVGFTISMGDGSQFQVTVVRSREARG